jgi:hypothetical protein
MHIDWLLKGEPRKAQIEALRRSYYGQALWDRNPDMFDLDESAPRVLRDGWAKGWGHYLQMRVGKTPVLLNEYELFARDEGIKKLIVIAPNKFKLDWPLEAERFGLSAPAFAWDPADKGAAYRFASRNERGLVSMNYEGLRYHETKEFLMSMVGPTTMIAADESIELKKHNSDRTPIAIAAAKECGVRRVLSGKPIVQGPHDIWAQLRFCGALNGFAYHAWKTMTCKVGGFKGKKILGVKDDMEKFVQDHMNENGWVARRKDWLVTPGSDYAERRIQLHPKQIFHYQQMQTDFLTELENGTLVEAAQIITRLIKQQQISSGFIYDENKQPHLLIPIEQNPKILEIKHMMENEIEGKVLLFAVHTPLIGMLREALAEYQPAVIAQNTDTIAEKARFNGDDKCRILIGQKSAVKYGHTLMGLVGTPKHACYTEIFVENNYSLNDRSQCEERPQGEGQQYPISIFDFWSSPADLAPIRALQRKEDVAAAVLNYARGDGILPPRPELRES